MIASQGIMARGQVLLTPDRIHEAPLCKGSGALFIGCITAPAATSGIIHPTPIEDPEPTMQQCAKSVIVIRHIVIINAANLGRRGAYKYHTFDIRCQSDHDFGRYRDA
jgi:hypothetical protein